jgi:hypothetical protein
MNDRLASGCGDCDPKRPVAGAPGTLNVQRVQRIERVLLYPSIWSPKRLEELRDDERRRRKRFGQPERVLRRDAR